LSIQAAVLQLSHAKILAKLAENMSMSILTWRRAQANTFLIAKLINVIA
jgi:hypothetical protein